LPTTIKVSCDAEEAMEKMKFYDVGVEDEEE
jgi:hypothetical protein